MLSLTYLPGHFHFRPGSRADYLKLHAFHYIPAQPRTFAHISAVDYCPSIDEPPRLIAAAVLSWPYPCSRARERYFNLAHFSYKAKLNFVNSHLRTISRVVVHPQFRSLGLARELIKNLLDHCPTRYVEASAVMGEIHPMFDRAGMQRINPGSTTEPAYFLFDKQPPADMNISGR